MNLPVMLPSNICRNHTACNPNPNVYTQRRYGNGQSLPMCDDDDDDDDKLVMLYMCMCQLT